MGEPGGTHGDVRTAAEAALPTLDAAEHLRGMGHANYLIAWLDYHRGRLEAADDRMHRVFQIRRELGRQRETFVPSSLVNGPQPLTDASLVAALGAMRRRGGRWGNEMIAQIGGLYALRGDGGMSDALAAEAIAVAEMLELPDMLGGAQMQAGISALRLGRLEEANTRLRRADAAFADAGDENYRSSALAFLQRVLVRQGALTDALTTGELALATSDDEDLLTRIPIAAARGLALAMDADPSGAALAEEAVAVAAGTQLVVALNDALTDLAGARRALGDRNGAAEAARRAIEGYEAKLATGAAASVRTEFADVL
jgi:tetratricopeptide (TPR) repeat protein